MANYKIDVLGIKFCKRCTAEITGAVYWFLGNYYCAACENSITNDPDYRFVLKNLGLRNIEC